MFYQNIYYKLILIKIMNQIWFQFVTMGLNSEGIFSNLKKKVGG